MVKIKNAPTPDEASGPERDTENPKDSGIFKQTKDIRKKTPISGIQPTVNKQIEDAIQSLAKAVDNDYGKLRHNARNPLSVAFYESDYLIHALTNNEPLENDLVSHLEAIRDAIKRSVDVLAGNLKNVDEEIGRIHVKLKKTEIAPIIEQATGAFETKCCFTIKGCLEDVTAICDPEILCQILYNLIENGIKYNESKVKKITIFVRSGSYLTSITIRDNGIGVHEEEQKKIFEDGYRSPSTAHKPGSGIGLHFAKKAIEEMNGHLRVDDDNPEEGTAFLIELMNGIPRER